MRKGRKIRVGRFNIQPEPVFKQQVLAPRRMEKTRLPMKTLIPPLLLFFALVIQLSVRITIIERGYRLEEVRKVALRNDTKLRQLRLDYAQLTSPNSLAEKGRTQLAMVTLTPQRVRRVQ